MLENMHISVIYMVIVIYLIELKLPQQFLFLVSITVSFF